MKCRYPLGFAVITVLSALVIPARLAAQQSKPHRHHYKLVELCTFGGPNSYINNVGNAGPYMNRRGDVVGSSMTSILIPPNQNGYSCPFPPNTDNVLHAMEWSHDGVTDLESLGDASNCSNALAINDQNKIPDPFSLFDFGIGGFTNGTETRAFLWQNGHMQDLKTLGGPDAWATFVSERARWLGIHTRIRLQVRPASPPRIPSSGRSRME